MGTNSTSSDRTLTFVYGPEHQRVMQVVALSANAPAALKAGAGTTWYFNGEDSQGLSYEKEVKTNGITEYKHYLSAGGMVFALQVTRTGNLAAGAPSVPGSTQSASLRYLHHDHLGSVAAITDGTTGTVIERLAFDPWGKRRNTNGQADTTDSLAGQTTDRGYTEHEHLDEMGLIHMNGRVYDPLVGRMMSADPFIQAPGSLQSYNRYAYVMNNPLNLTDPSGYFSLRGFLRKLDTFVRNPSTSNAYNVHRSMPGVVAVDNFVVKNPWAYALGRAAAGFWGGPWAAAGASAYYAYITTGSDSAAIKAFGLSIGTSYAFEMAGDVGTGANEYGASHYAAHAAVGCASSVAGGGQCGAGALSAVAGLGATQFGGFAGGTTAARFAYAAVAGGVASRLAGGSFIDGAQTAAYGFLFNCMQHDCAEFTKVDPMGNPLGDNPLAGDAQLMVAGGAAALAVGSGAILATTSAMQFMSTVELKAVIAANGGNQLLNANGLFGSGVVGARAALNNIQVPDGVNRTLLLAYREIATRNISMEVQQIRIQIIDKMLPLIKK